MNRIAVFCLLCLFAAACRDRQAEPPAASDAAIPVWIDTDPSAAPGGHEVDDAFALIQAFHSPELAIHGVSVVFGNAQLPVALDIARELAASYGPKGLAVHAGAAGADQMGEESNASRALAAALERAKLTILALGPATNIATVVKNHPGLIANISSIVAVAGRRPGQRFTTSAGSAPFRDFNFELDAEAFRVLLDSAVPITLAPWEISSKVWLGQAELDRLAAGTEASRWLHRPAADWLALWREQFGVDGFNPFDTLAVTYLARPDLLVCEDLPVEIRLQPDDTLTGEAAGTESADKPYLVADPGIVPRRKVRYCHTPAPEFKEHLMERLLRRN